MDQRTSTHRRPAVRRKKNILQYEWVRVLLFYIVPFVVINLLIFFLVTTKPSYEVILGDTDDYRTADVTFAITSYMPLKNVTISLDGELLDLVQVGNRKYRSTITRNGVLEIHMENFNGMAVTGYEVIDILDNELPDVVNYSVDENILTMILSDTQSGIDYDNLFATTSDGEEIYPLSVDRNTGVVVFQINTDLTLHIRDLSGNEYSPSFSLVMTENGESTVSEIGE